MTLDLRWHHPSKSHKNQDYCRVNEIDAKYGCSCCRDEVRLVPTCEAPTSGRARFHLGHPPPRPFWAFYNNLLHFQASPRARATFSREPLFSLMWFLATFT